MRIMASRMTAATERAERSKSPARRRKWLIQARVREVPAQAGIQRLGTTSKRGTAARLTISRRHFPVLATVSAMIGPG